MKKQLTKGKKMKINYSKVLNENPHVMNKCVYKFSIVGAIMKGHYKELARMSMLFKNNAGFIRTGDEAKFEALLNKIENSDNKRCETSKKKAQENYSKNKSKSACEHGDLGSLGYKHGTLAACPSCGKTVTVW